MHSLASFIEFLLHGKFCSALCGETTLELLCSVMGTSFLKTVGIIQGQYQKEGDQNGCGIWGSNEALGAV